MSFTDSITKLVGGILERMGIHYYAIRVYRVEAQNADGTLELQPTDQVLIPGSLPLVPPGTVPGLSNVKIYQLTPGTTIHVPNNSNVLVAFLNGRPDRRFAFGLWDGNNCTQLIMKCDDLQLGGPATEHVLLGDTYQTKWTSVNKQLIIDLNASAAAFTAAGMSPVPAVGLGFVKLAALCLHWAAALTTFEGSTTANVSSKVKASK